MPGWEKWLWGGLGGAFGGPIGGILGFALGSMADRPSASAAADQTVYPRTRPGDFGVSLMVLLAAVIRADQRLLKSELTYIKQFFVQTFGEDFARERMILFRDIMEVDPQADKETIKKAYRRMANRYHPDKVNHLGPEFLAVAEEKFKAINEAYQTIRAERGILKPVREGKLL